MDIFQKGDVVWHTVLESEKVVVGVGEDRYLCVRLSDIDSAGRLHPNVRVAMHRADNLKKIGHRDVAGVNLTSLYERESVSRHFFMGRWLREEVLINALFLLAFTLIIFAFFVGVDLARNRFEEYVSRKMHEKEMEYRIKIRQELREKRHATSLHAE